MVEDSERVKNDEEQVLRDKEKKEEMEEVTNKETWKYWEVINDT